MSISARGYFEGRRLSIASMHSKEQVMASKLEAFLGVRCESVPNLNTDSLGTFSGEVEREGAPIDILRKKCLLGLESVDTTLVIANEGSFGPHPLCFFTIANEEHILLVDIVNNLEIYERIVTSKTNFGAKEVNSKDEVEEFTRSVKFPSHAVIIKDKKLGYNEIRKGVSCKSELLEVFSCFYNRYGTAFIETDMRAMCNPTRMEQIGIVTEKLLNKICSMCPKCTIPGFGVTETISGLPCACCGIATKSTLAFVYCCKRCEYSETKEYPKGKYKENPMYCDFCNP
jgi:hypothetical protein